MLIVRKENKVKDAMTNTFSKSAASPDSGGYKHIFITGYPGAGKTTLARQLAKKHNMDTIHLDTVPGVDHTPDIDELVRTTISGLDRPSVVEGVQLMDLGPEYFKGQDLRMLEVPKDTLVSRIVNRGFQDKPDGPIVRLGHEEAVARAQKFLSQFDTAARRFSKRSSTREHKVKIDGLMRKMGFEKGAAKVDKMFGDPEFIKRLTSTAAGRNQLKQLGIGNLGKDALDVVSGRAPYIIDGEVPYNSKLFGELMTDQRRTNAARASVFSEIAGKPMAHYSSIGDVPQGVRERMGAIRATQGTQTRKLLRRIATKNALRRIISRAKAVAPYAAGAAALGGGAYYLANRGEDEGMRTVRKPMGSV
jgi:hypothetical protein